MTTTVLIGTQGNKAVEITSPQGTYKLEPGRWATLSIHGEQTIAVKETGDFVTAPASLQRVEATAQVPASTHEVGQ